MFLICLAISAFIWLTRALSKEYATELTVKVEYVGIPSDLGWVTPLPEIWSVKVSSYGFGLLGNKYFSTHDAVVVDLSRLSREGKVEIETLDFASSVARQLGSDNQILEIEPRVINSELSMNRSKLVPIHTPITTDLPAGFFVSPSIVSSPDSVLVTGPMLLLDTLRWIETEPVVVSLESSKEPIETTLVPKNGVSIPEDPVSLTVSIDEFTEGHLVVPIQHLDISETQFIRTIPDSTKITFQVGLKDYESLTQSDFTIEPEVPENVSLESLYKLRLKIVMSPENVQNLQIDPARVEFILVNKNN